MIEVPTQSEVDERYEARLPGDPLGFEVDEYTPYMSCGGLRAIAKEGTTDEDIAEVQSELTQEAMLKEMEEYMEFAWGKANDERGISANRSIQHYIAWTWLAGDRDLSAEVERLYAEEYDFYGKPILRKICEFYGWDWKQWDEDE